MEPNNTTPPTPPTTPSPSELPKPTPPSEPASPELENIFLLRTEEERPVDKKGIAFTIILTIVGLIVLVGVLIFALIASAEGLANDYRSRELAQITKIDGALESLEPSIVINQRNLDEPLAKVKLSEQSQPSLDSVLLVGQWNERYVSTEKVQVLAKQHYTHITNYAEDIKKLLAFDQQVQAILVQDPEVVATIKQDNSFTFRAVSGTYESFAKDIKEIPVSKEIEQIKADVLKRYQDKSQVYIDWALGLEQNNPAAVVEAKEKIDLLTSELPTIIEDEKYVAAFESSYEKLVKEHQELKQLLQ